MCDAARVGGRLSNVDHGVAFLVLALGHAFPPAGRGVSCCPLMNPTEQTWGGLHQHSVVLVLPPTHPPPPSEFCCARQLIILFFLNSPGNGQFDTNLGGNWEPSSTEKHSLFSAP